MKRTERTVTVLWAGIFLALFYANIYERKAPPFVPWDQWKGVEEVGAEIPTEPVKRPERPHTWADNRREPPFEGFVGADTVSAEWLRRTGHWPEWKALRLVDLREAWGGLDSLLGHREEWGRVSWTWVWTAPEPVVLSTVSADFLYTHPLWRSDQVRAFHRFRSKVRPVKNWEELFQLADFDSIQRTLLPTYFKINSLAE